MAVAAPELSGDDIVISSFFLLAILGGIGFALWTGFGRVVDANERAALDPARVVRSAAIAFGMFLAMLAITVGLIDLFQAFVAGERIVGSNSDLARALSLLIVGTPVFGLLARQLDKQRKERLATGDSRPGIGWSAHLVAALTTTLVGVLVSCGQVIDDVANGQGAEMPEVAQLAGWLVVWLAYWFGLRPRLGVRGHVHLLIGSVFGLAWIITGLVGLGNELGSQAYARLFATPVVGGANLSQWVLAAAVGVVTWLWHWRVLDLARSNGIETRPRRSRSWFAMVVGVGIVPALIAGLVAIGGALSGVLIWFLGSPEESAVDWFEDAPSVLVVGCLALAVWAFHRWLLQRDGDPARNEALRFHDYVIAGVGLIAVVSGVALVVGLVIEAATARSLIASSYEMDNRLIGTLVLLAIGSALWWSTWGRIDRSQQVDPIAESSSSWRKLYLIIAGGLGGLTLAGCLIWILFTVLRDLFDGELGLDTLDGIAGPVGWALAVLAGVWFHLGIWRADRVVLEAAPAVLPPPPGPAQEPVALSPREVELSKLPPPPAAPPASVSAASLQPEGPSIRWATQADHGELFTLQRAAFVDEAMAYDTPLVPGLTESFAEFGQRTGSVPTFVIHDGAGADRGRIVGAVSVREHDELPWLERLMVAPDRRNEQLGHELVRAVVTWAEAKGHDALRAVVGDRNPLLLAFYASLDFETIGRTAATDTAPELLVMERRIGAAVTEPLATTS